MFVILFFELCWSAEWRANEYQVKLIMEMVASNFILAVKSTESSSLYFSGDLSWWVALLIALASMVLAFWIYRGDLLGRTATGLWVLPPLRAGS